MKTSESINELAKAMSIAQKEMKPASKDALNPHYKSKYSNITSVWESIREPLTNNSLTVWQDVITEEKSVSVITRIIHSSGQWVEFGPLSIPLYKFDAHAIGSATSYAKRYALCAAIGVVSDDDDDGEGTFSDNQKAERYDDQLKKEFAQRKKKSELTTDQVIGLKKILEKESTEQFRKGVYKWMADNKISSLEEICLTDYHNIIADAENNKSGGK